jgi:hypothetical protein
VSISPDIQVMKENSTSTILPGFQEIWNGHGFSCQFSAVSLKIRQKY